MEFFSIVLFAFALSLDGFAVALTYGLRRITIPLASIFVIVLASAGAVGISMIAGGLVAGLLPPAAARGIGAVILIVVGIWLTVRLYRLQPDPAQCIGAERTARAQRTEETQETHDGRRMVQGPGMTRDGDHPLPARMIRNAARTLRRVIDEPLAADRDRSGEIGPAEAMFLGIALAMDALAAGFGASAAGLPVALVPPMVGFFKLVMVSLGLILGNRYGRSRLGEGSSAVPGIVLIILGVFKALHR